MFVEYLNVILFLDIPNEDALVHARRDKETGVEGPAEVEDVFSVAHEATFGRPAEDAFGPVDWEAVLAFLPDGDALVVGSRGEEGAVGGVADDVGVFVGFWETVEDA